MYCAYLAVDAALKPTATDQLSLLLDMVSDILLSINVVLFGLAQAEFSHKISPYGELQTRNLVFGLQICLTLVGTLGVASSVAMYFLSGRLEYSDIRIAFILSLSAVAIFDIFLTMYMLYFVCHRLKVAHLPHVWRFFAIWTVHVILFFVDLGFALVATSGAWMFVPDIITFTYSLSSFLCMLTLRHMLANRSSAPRAVLEPSTKQDTSRIRAAYKVPRPTVQSASTIPAIDS
jgi:hypothetical protein